MIKLTRQNEDHIGPLNAELQALLTARLAPDYLLYNYFLKKFNTLVDQYGVEAMTRDREKYLKACRIIQQKCDFVEKEERQMTGEVVRGIIYLVSMQLNQII